MSRKWVWKIAGAGVVAPPLGRFRTFFLIAVIGPDLRIGTALKNAYANIDLMDYCKLGVEILGISVWVS